jgi:hypothetical protein
VNDKNKNQKKRQLQFSQFVSMCSIFDNLFFRTRSLLIIITYLSFVAMSVFTLYRTWRYGYHTIRQIINGVLFALFVHFILTFYVFEGLAMTNNNITKKNKTRWFCISRSTFIQSFLIFESIGQLLSVSIQSSRKRIVMCTVLAITQFVTFVSVVRYTGEFPFSFFEMVIIGILWLMLIAAHR